MCQQNDILDLSKMVPILLSIATFIMSCLVWKTQKRQAEINAEKLRLDLYNRRFDIYSKTLAFYQALISYTSESKESFSSKQKSFITSVRESQFLFKPEHGVFNLLEEMHTKSFQITGTYEWREASASCPEVYQNEINKSNEVLKWLNEVAIEKLEKSMTPYLDFHNIRE